MSKLLKTIELVKQDIAKRQTYLDLLEQLAHVEKLLHGVRKPAKKAAAPKKRKISKAGIERIRKAQRARWAKIKAAKKAAPVKKAKK